MGYGQVQGTVTVFAELLKIKEVLVQLPAKGSLGM